MPRQKSGNFDQGKYVAAYMRDKIKQVKVSLNKTKPEDQKIIEWLENMPGEASGYIKRLIREDMQKGGNGNDYQRTRSELDGERSNR